MNERRCERIVYEKEKRKEKKKNTKAKMERNGWRRGGIDAFFLLRVAIFSCYMVHFTTLHVDFLA